LLRWQRQAVPSKISMRPIKIFFFLLHLTTRKHFETAINAQRDFVSTSVAKENEERACNHQVAIFFLIAPVPLR
jgi:hypothetical protein